MQARLRAAIAHAAIARAAIARAAIARAAIARAQPTYSIVWRQNTGGLRAARVLSSVVRRRWQADNRCDGDGRWAMDNMRSAWIVVAIGACVRCVFFFFLLCTIPLRTHCTYLSTTYSHIMSHALFLIPMYVSFFDRRCFLGFAVVCDGGSRGNVGRREKYVVKLKEIK